MYIIYSSEVKKYQEPPAYKNTTGSTGMKPEHHNPLQASLYPY